MQQLRAQQEECEVKAASLLQQAQQRLSQTALTDSELSAARGKAAAAAELEVLAEATGHRSELLQVALHKVEQELAAEVATYRATRKTEALQQLAGHLSEDTTAAAQQLERRTAELQRLEAAVADKAAVLQKLDDELTSKQQQQQQQRQLQHSLSSSSAAGDGLQLTNGKEQLLAVQQQLSQAEKQLAAADVALLEKRAAVAEAEEQLTAVRRETSVCEPRLNSLRQQLQELEATIRARDTELQVLTQACFVGSTTHSSTSQCCGCLLRCGHDRLLLVSVCQHMKRNPQGTACVCGSRQSSLSTWLLADSHQRGPLMSSLTQCLTLVYNTPHAVCGAQG